MGRNSECFTIGLGVYKLLEKYCVKVMLTAIVVACFVPFLFLGDGAQKWTLFFRTTAKHSGQLKCSEVTEIFVNFI